jgi:hypothetical protein
MIKGINSLDEFKEMKILKLQQVAEEQAGIVEDTIKDMDQV